MTYPVTVRLHDLDPAGPRLSYQQKRVLALGLTFAPPDAHNNLTNFDAHRLLKAVQWRITLGPQSQAAEIPRLALPSTKRPPEHARAQTAPLAFRIYHAVGQLNEQLSTLPAHPYVAIANSIRNDPGIVICKADKGLGLCKMSPQQYDDMCSLFLQHLHKLDNGASPQEIVAASHRAVHSWLQLAKALNIEFSPFRYIVERTKQCDTLPKFYALVKLHKGTNTPLQPRPIIAAHDSPTSAVSTWLSHALVPVVQRMPTYIRDSSHLIELLRSRTFPDGARVFTGDVAAMYPNMRPQETINNTMEALSIAYNGQMPPWTKLVPRAIQLLYDYNYFTYKDEMYLQNQGIAMGSNASAPLSDLYLVIAELHFLQPLINSGAAYYGRFRDDIIAVCEPYMAQSTLIPFKEAIQPLELILSEPATRAAFLDIEVHIHQGKLEFRTYSKESNLHFYIPPFSNHPPHTKRSWVYGEILRLHRTNSKQEWFLERIKLLFAALRQRGYGNALIEQAAKKWTNRFHGAVAFPGPTTPVKLLPLLGNDAMPTAAPPPLIFAIPTDPMLRRTLLPILFGEYAALKSIYTHLPQPTVAYTMGRKLGQWWSTK